MLCIGRKGVEVFFEEKVCKIFGFELKIVALGVYVTVGEIPPSLLYWYTTRGQSVLIKLHETLICLRNDLYLG